jgi:hypothetical protein
MASLKLGSGLGLFISVVLVVFVGLQYLRMARYQPPRWTGASAKLPCLADNRCPMGQSCMNGFCSEGFMAPVMTPSTDMSSCTANECKGINAPCARSATPCAEGTFCQNNSCVSIATADQGEAYSQIGMLLN